MRFTIKFSGNVYKYKERNNTNFKYEKTLGKFTLKLQLINALAFKYIFQSILNLILNPQIKNYGIFKIHKSSLYKYLYLVFLNKTNNQYGFLGEITTLTISKTKAMGLNL